MKQLIFLAFITFIIQSANAQLNGGKHVGATGVGGNFAIQNNDGRMIPIGVKEDTKGSPMLLDNWVQGTVILKNGVKFNDSALNYSLYEDKLYFKRDNQFFIVAGIINEFYLAKDEDNKAQELYHFVSGYPASATTNENTFYQLLADGGKYQLLKWRHKRIRELYNYGGVNESEYAGQEAYYVFEKAAHKMWSLGNKTNVQQIKNTLSVDESIWKAYLYNQLGNNKSETGMIEFINYLNKL